MEGFRQAVCAICVVSAVSCLIVNLVSGTRLRAQVKLLLDLTAAVAVIAPFSGIKGGMAFPEFSVREPPDYTYMLELYDSEFKRTAEENISSVLMSQITAKGISCEKVEASINISEDGSIFISSVALRTDDFKAAAEVVRSSLGAETEVSELEEQ